MSKKEEKIEITPLQIITGAYEKAVAEINDLSKQIEEDYQSRGGVSPKVAKEMAKERWILGGIFMLSNKNAGKEIAAELTAKIQEQRDKENKIDEEIKNAD